MPFVYADRPHVRKHGPAGYTEFPTYKPWLRDEFHFRCVYCLERERWYPSGHAAYSTAWVAAAVMLTRRLGLLTKGTLVFVALGIAAAVGVSRVYLRAHWWSDVVGGWGLAAAIFSLLAGIALVVDYFRNNGERRAEESRESAVARGA